MKNHAFIFSALFISGALFPLPEFSDPIDSSPKPRHLEELVYHKDNKALYLFGGSEPQGQNWIEPNDFFEYKNSWKHRDEKGPIGRRGHSLLYDENTKSILLLGGVAQTRSGADSVLFDLWSWTNGVWKLINHKCPVKETRAVYDIHEKRLLVYGDANNPSKPWTGGDEKKLELWQFQSGDWRKLSDVGPTDGHFPLSYNRKSRSLSLLQWVASNRLVHWQWKNEKWQTHEFSSDFPPVRNKYAFTYSTTDAALFVFGGVDSKRDLLGDFWKFDGKSWIKIELPSNPSARACLRFVDADDKVLLYGGVTKSGLTNELWEFKNNVWIKQ